MSDLSFNTAPLAMRTDGRGPETPQPMRAPKGTRGDRPNWRARVLQGLKTFLWVAPLTVLLWVYAEQEKLDKRENVPVRVEVVPPSPDRIVTLVGATGGELRQEDLRLDLEGPSSSVAAILDPRAWPLKITIDEPAPYNGYIPVAERLNLSEPFSSKAVKVKRAEPTMLRVRVERRVSKEIPIAVRPDQKNTATVVEPAKMAVDGPESLFRSSELVVYADVSEFAGKEPGERDAEVPIALYDIRAGEQTPLSNPFVTLPQVKTLRVKVPEAKIVEYTLTKTIGLTVRMPAATLADDTYKYDIPRVNLPNIKVKGPPDAIAQLKSDPPQFKAAAVLTLVPEDFNNVDTTISKELDTKDFILPPGVTVVGKVPVEFTIKKRQP